MDKSRAPIVSESPLASAIRFAALHSPYYKGQAWAASLRRGRRLKFRDIPVTSSSLVKADPVRFFSPFIAPDEGGVSIEHTSGSTGEPLEVRQTKRCSFLNRAENQRLYRSWGTSAHKRIVHARDPSKEKPPGTIEERHTPRGVHHWKIYTVETGVVADLLRRTSASFVTGLPSVLQDAIEDCSGLNILRLVCTVGEIISDEFKSLVASIPNCILFDSYGCTEAGIIAAQCPLCQAYHPADRHLALELLNEDGSPTPPGEMGRVIVTPYYNQAMPLIRYELRDYAVRSVSNVCPNSKYSIDRIVGRERNLFTLQNGRKISPFFPAKEARRLGIRKLKMVQLSLDHIELRYIPLSDDIELQPDVVQKVIDNYVSPEVKVTPVRVQEIPRAPSGKYLMHESMVK